MSLEKIINDAWEIKDQINQNTDQKTKDAINQVINDLDSGKSRVAEKINGEWITHQYLKKAIMLSFRMYPMENLNGPYSSWYDKAHLLKGKTAGWTKEDHEKFNDPNLTIQLGLRTLTDEQFETTLSEPQGFELPTHIKTTAADIIKLDDYDEITLK